MLRLVGVEPSYFLSSKQEVGAISRLGGEMIPHTYSSSGISQLVSFWKYDCDGDTAHRGEPEIEKVFH